MPIFGLPAIFEKGVGDVHDEPQMALGGCYISNTDDAIYTYVRFAEDVQQGAAMQTKYNHYSKQNLSPQTNGGTVYAPAGSREITEYNATYLTSLAGFPTEPTHRDYARIRVQSGAGIGQEGYITNYTDTVLKIGWYDSDDGTLKTALDGTSDYLVWAPWYMQEARSDAAAARIAAVNGVVIAESAKKDQYGFVGVEGDFPVLVNAVLTAGDPLIPDVIANKGKGTLPDAADIVNTYATVQSNTTAANTLVTATVYAQRISQVKQIAEGLVRGFPVPDAT